MPLCWRSPPNTSNTWWSASRHYWFARLFWNLYKDSRGRGDGSVDKMLAVPNMRTWVWIFPNYIKIMVLGETARKHSWDLLASQPGWETYGETPSQKPLASTNTHTHAYKYVSIYIPKPSYIPRFWCLDTFTQPNCILFAVCLNHSLFRRGVYSPTLESRQAP